MATTTTPDVRVRLSAEGVQEVVNALKAVQAQSQKAAQQTQAMGGGLSAAAQGVAALQRSVGLLAGAFAAVNVVGFAQQTTGMAETLGRASVQTGIAVEELSRFTYAAKACRVDAETLYDALADLSEKMFDAASGSGDGAEALKAMGFSADYAKKNINDLPKIIGDIADKFASYEDGAAKTALAVKLFGDAGKDLLPWLNLGSAGIRQLMGESDKLGATVRESAVVEAIKFNTQLAKLRASAEGLATAIMGPTVGALNTLIDRFRTVSDAGGKFQNYLSAIFSTVGFRDSIAAAEKDVERLQRKLMDGRAVDPNGALFKGYLLARKNLLDLQNAQAQGADTTKQTPRDKAPEIPGGEGERVARAQAELQAAKARVEVQLVRVRNQQLAEEDRQRFEQGLLSLQDYHDRRLEAVKRQGAAELAAAEQQLKAAKALPGNTAEERIARERAVAEATAARQQAQMQAEIALMSVERNNAVELRAHSIAQLELQQRLLELKGQTKEAAVAALDAEIKKLDELLAKQGLSADARQAKIAEFRKPREAHIQFNDAATRGGRELASLDMEKAAVQNQVASGELFPIQGEMRMLELTRQRLATLREISAEMAAAATTPEMQQQAAAFAGTVGQLETSTHEWGVALGQVKANVQDQLVSGFSNAVVGIMQGNANITESFRNMALAVVDAIAQVMVKMMAMKAIEMMGFSTGGQVGTPAVKKATGGYISGPGTGTSDSIPAWLSNGEYVIRAAAVQALGTQTLDLINRTGRLPLLNRHSTAGVKRFADGGLVSSMQAAASGGGNSSLTVGLEPGLVLRELQSPQGQRVLVETLGKNKRSLRATLG